MCGIVGIINLKSQIKEYENSHFITCKMIDAIHHRGPDEEGIYSSKNVSLGHARLTILDAVGSKSRLG